MVRFGCAQGVLMTGGDREEAAVAEAAGPPAVALQNLISTLVLPRIRGLPTVLK